MYVVFEKIHIYDLKAQSYDRFSYDIRIEMNNK